MTEGEQGRPLTVTRVAEIVLLTCSGISPEQQVGLRLCVETGGAWMPVGLARLVKKNFPELIIRSSSAARMASVRSGFRSY